MSVFFLACATLVAFSVYGFVTKHDCYQRIHVSSYKNKGEVSVIVTTLLGT